MRVHRRNRGTKIQRSQLETGGFWFRANGQSVGRAGARMRRAEPHEGYEVYEG